MSAPMKLVGYDNFVRHNPKSDKFGVKKFHHIEFWCNDATNVYQRFMWGLGMSLVAKSDQSTGNHTYCSYVVKSKDIVFVFSAPYAQDLPDATASKAPFPDVTANEMHEFSRKHGFGARAIALEVEDAQVAFDTAVKNGGKPLMAPQILEGEDGKMVVADVMVYGDTAMRFVSGSCTGNFMPGFENVEGYELCYGLKRIDHTVGNVPKLLETVEYVTGFTGFHEFAEFTAEDVGTVDSGLNSMVLANNSETVLMPVNEPTYGTRRKSQIQTYLEQNNGAGLQHIALLTEDIFATMRELKKRTRCGGFDFMPRASDAYYKNLPNKIGDVLTPEMYKEVEELGLLVDKDDQGVLVQVFTKPLGDRPTIFVEIIQRIGCMHEDKATGKVEQSAGCGGFGKGNFGELFKSIEDYERELFKDEA
eukprot:Rmarinus@m.4843